MFLLDVTLPGVSSPPSKSPGQVLQSSIPTIAIGALMTVLGGGALWKGVGSTGRILPYLRWVLAIGGPLVAASGFMPGSSSGPGLPPLPATPAVTTHPAEPLNLDNEGKREPGLGFFQSVKNFFCGTGTNELLENLLSGDVKGGKLIKDLSVFLNSTDFATRKRAASAMVQNAYGEDGSGSLASTANSFLGIALLKDSDNAIVEGILEGLTGLEVCREAAPALKELQSILGETGESVDFKKDLGVTIAKISKKPLESASKKKDGDLGISLSPPETIGGIDLEAKPDPAKKKTASSSSSTEKGSPKLKIDKDSGAIIIGLDEEPVLSDPDADVSAGTSKGKSKSVSDDKKTISKDADKDSSIFEVDFEVPPLDESGSSSGVVADEEDSDFAKFVSFAEEDAKEAKEASRKGSSSTPIKKEEEKSIFDDDDFGPRPSLDSDSVVIEDPSGEVDEKESIFDDDLDGSSFDDSSSGVGLGSDSGVIKHSGDKDSDSGEFELDLDDDSEEIDLTGAHLVEDSDLDSKTPESIASNINKDFKKWGYSVKVIDGEIIIEKGKDRYSFSHIDDEGDLLVIDQRSGYECFILKRDGKVVAAG